ncbi:ribosome-binding protein 1 [Arapaima gigas]
MWNEAPPDHHAAHYPRKNNQPKTGMEGAAACLLKALEASAEGPKCCPAVNGLVVTLPKRTGASDVTTPVCSPWGSEGQLVLGEMEPRTSVKKALENSYQAAMDVYDPQTLGIMVFGGFMVISAIGIALVSTFSMKETSYEEALANQRRELNKAQLQRSEKKKKDKPSEKRSRAKKKEEKANGKLPEQEQVLEADEMARDLEPDPSLSSAPVVAPVSEPVVVAAIPTPAVASAPTPTPVATQAACPVTVEALPVPSPKEKKKKEKKATKVEPAPTQSPATPTQPPASPTQSVAAPTQAATPPSKPAASSSKLVTPSSKTATSSSKPTAPSSKPVTGTSKPTTAPSKAATPVMLEAVTKEVPVMAMPPVGPRASPPAATSAPANTKVEELKVEKVEAPSKKKAGSKKKAEPVPADPAEAPLQLPYKTLVSTISSMMFSESEAQRLIEILSDKAGIMHGTWHTATQKGDPMVALKKQLEEKEKQLTAEQEDVAAAKNRVRELSKELSAEKSKLTNVETRLSSQLSSREQEIKALQSRMQASYQDHVAETQKLNAKIQSLQDQLEKGPNAQLARLQQENSILRDALNQATSQTESKQNAELAKLRQECAKLSKELGDKSDSLLAEEQQRKALETKVASAEKQLAVVQVSKSGERTSDPVPIETEQQSSREKIGTFSTTLIILVLIIRLQKRRHSMLSGSNGTSTQVLWPICHSCVVARGEQLWKCIQTSCLGLHGTYSSRRFDETALGCIKKDGVDSAFLLTVIFFNFKQPDNTATLEQLHNCLKEKDNQVAMLEKEVQELKDDMNQVRNANDQLENTAKMEWLQNSLTEKDGQVTLLERELQQVREELVQVRNTHTDYYILFPVSCHLSSLNDKEGQVLSLEAEVQHLKEEMEQVRSSSKDTERRVHVFETETKLALQNLFPHIPVGTEQTEWLKEFTQKAQEAQQSQQSHVAQQESQQVKSSSELLDKFSEVEESRNALQAECDQYRTVLAETEGMLKNLQMSVEEEEQVWRAKMAALEEQLRKALDQVQTLEATAEQMREENQSTQQLREQVMLLEAQLEKQLESASSDTQGYSEEMAQLKQLLSETQSQLEVAQSEAQKQSGELALVRQHLSEMEQAQHSTKAHGPQNGQLEPGQVQSELEQRQQKVEGERALRQQLTEEFEQAQRCVIDLQAQLDLLRAAGDGTAPDTEDVSQLKERLEKEKKLSKDLGQAATKLQQLLKATQEQLSKEKDTVRRLRDQLQGKDGPEELKEGTSV